MRGFLEIGSRFDRLIVIEKTKSIDSSGAFLYKCICDCGCEKHVSKYNLVHGLVKSCGCKKREHLISYITKHGKCSDKLYKIYRGIMNRCYCHSQPNYKKYGGRGVIVCEEWKNNPTSFIEWALSNGWKNGMYIDKDIKAIKMGVTPNLYSPERCSVVSPKQNSRFRENSKFYIHNGELMNLSSLCELYSMNHNTLKYRLDKLGWSVDKAVNTPLGNQQKWRRDAKLKQVE